MKKWIITIGVIVALLVAGATTQFWVPSLWSFLGQNADEIGALSSLLQLVIWFLAGLAVVISLWASRKKPHPDPPASITHIHQAAPPPAATPLHQLPPPPGDFTGREAELDELLSKVEAGGVAISGLQGMGGVGKTALALMLAERLTPRYPDAQFYLNLKGASPGLKGVREDPLSPAEALGHVIRSYQPEAKLPEDASKLSDSYRSLLHGKRAILLMDNASDKEQVLPLIPPAGSILLVTSRNRFTLPGIHAKNLNQLPPEDARKLLLRIAKRIGDHAAAIAEKCGYLPIALRAAGSALAERIDLTPEDYLRRFGGRQDPPRTCGCHLPLEL